MFGDLKRRDDGQGSVFQLLKIFERPGLFHIKSLFPAIPDGNAARVDPFHRLLSPRSHSQPFTPPATHVEPRPVGLTDRIEPHGELRRGVALGTPKVILQGKLERGRQPRAIARRGRNHGCPGTQSPYFSL